MSKKKTYDEVSVVAKLSRKRSVRVDRAQKVIYVERDNYEVGNGSWGKIDYLVHYCGYTQLWVAKKEPKVTAVKDDREAKKVQKPKRTLKGLKISKKLQPIKNYAEL